MKFHKYSNLENVDTSLLGAGDVVMIRKGSSPYYWEQYKLTSDGDLAFVRGVTDEQYNRLEQITQSLIDKLSNDYTKEQIDDIEDALRSLIVSTTAGLPEAFPNSGDTLTATDVGQWTILTEGTYHQPGYPSIEVAEGKIVFAQFDGTQFSIQREVEISGQDISGLASKNDVVTLQFASGILSPRFERGTINTSGQPASHANNLRSEDFEEIPLTGINGQIKSDSLLRAEIFYYKSDNTFIASSVKFSEFLITKSDYPDAEKIKIKLYKSNSTMVNPDDLVTEEVLFFTSGALPQGIPTWTPKVYLSGNQTLHGGAIWEVSPGEVAEATDIPGSSLKWVAKAGDLTLIDHNIQSLVGAYTPILERGTINTSGQPVNSTTHMRSPDFIPIPQGGIDVSIKQGSTFRIEVNYYDSDFQFLIAVPMSGEFSVRKSDHQGAEFVKFQYYKRTSETVNINDIVTEEVVMINNVTAINRLVPSSVRGKKILWLGTSIPAGSSAPILGTTLRNAYPNILAQQYGFTVYNEAIRTSAVKRGRFIAKTENDPFGITGMLWQRLMLGLSWTLSEAQDLIDNWSSWQPLLSNAPTSLTQSDIDSFLAASHEHIFAKYWGNDAVFESPDVVVIDHMRNDFIPEVTNDSGEDVETIPADPYDRTTTIGALNYIVKKILEHDNKVKVVVIGHYDDHESERLIKAQETFADHWKFPFLRLWEKTGFTLNTINTDGHWVGGTSSKTWSEHGNPGGFRNMSLIDIWLPDGVHPGNDASGTANLHLAEIIGSFLNGS